MRSRSNAVVANSVPFTGDQALTPPPAGILVEDTDLFSLFGRLEIRDCDALPISNPSSLISNHFATQRAPGRDPTADRRHPRARSRDESSRARRPRRAALPHLAAGGWSRPG